MSVTPPLGNHWSNPEPWTPPPAPKSRRHTDSRIESDSGPVQCRGLIRFEIDPIKDVVMFEEDKSDPQSGKRVNSSGDQANTENQIALSKLDDEFFHAIDILRLQMIELSLSDTRPLNDLVAMWRKRMKNLVELQARDRIDNK